MDTATLNIKPSKRKTLSERSRQAYRSVFDLRNNVEQEIRYLKQMEKKHGLFRSRHLLNLATKAHFLCAAVASCRNHLHANKLHSKLDKWQAEFGSVEEQKAFLMMNLSGAAVHRGVPTELFDDRDRFAIYRLFVDSMRIRVEEQLRDLAKKEKEQGTGKSRQYIDLQTKASIIYMVISSAKGKVHCSTLHANHESWLRKFPDWNEQGYFLERVLVGRMLYVVNYRGIPAVETMFTDVERHVLGEFGLRRWQEQRDTEILGCVSR